MPNGFRSQDDNDLALYNAHLLRAQLPEILEPTTTGMVGLVHHLCVPEIRFGMPPFARATQCVTAKSGYTLSRERHLLSAFSKKPGGQPGLRRTLKFGAGQLRRTG